MFYWNVSTPKIFRTELHHFPKFIESLKQTVSSSGEAFWRAKYHALENNKMALARAKFPYTNCIVVPTTFSLYRVMGALGIYEIVEMFCYGLGLQTCI